MKDTAYAYAVARIRANEKNLLSSSDMEMLISAPNLNTALNFLKDKGWGDIKSDEEINDNLLKQAEQSWQLLQEIAPDKSELLFLIIKNDFHNIKAALKSFISDKRTDSFIMPSIIAPEVLYSAVKSRNYDEFPHFVKDAINKTYDVLTRTFDGQLADIMLDAMSLNATIEMAERTNNRFIIDLAELICATANIKIALRAAYTGKDEQFLDTALCNTKSIDKSELKKTAAKGTDELLGYLSSTAYSAASEQIKISFTAFEKWCDDILMNHITNAKYVSFGVQPLIAYYIAKDAEIKNIRILLSCKHNNIPNEKIKERMRMLYA